ncbi:beta-N-acetylhexosaminidase [Pedobacter arcticus]|uniref:beta-N-acetylhexosaminidase n=1 Tax=Pedobacter arcticus TaxID=752140 RepID=UPI00030C2414|nr:family 20 glycosylhydrolase [Pedobacter arcticus]
MRKINYFLGVFVLAVQFSFAQSSQTLNLMPVPSNITVNQGKLRIDSNFNLAITGNVDERLYKATTRFLRRLDEQTILWFVQDQISKADNSPKAVLQIHVQRPGLVKLKEDESYQLNIDKDHIKISATTDIGAMYALETLLQLLEADENGFYFPQVSIKDNPRFAWRGLMIDVVRHWIPYEVIIRNIDAMLGVKMNVLHLHLTDDQGFRVESKVHPLLHEKGSNGKYLTQAQLKDIVKYAADRGIRVVPEFDMPGHASTWFPGYPEYASAPGPYQIETKYSHFEPAPTMDPTNEKLYPFIDAFIAEMASTFPDEYIHIGGDENRGAQWDANPKIQEFKKTHNLTDNMALQTYFNGRLQKILAKYNRKMMGWDEILEPGISKDIMIHSWRGKNSLNEAAKKGYPVIISSGFYVDLLRTAEDYYLNEPLAESDDLTPSQLANVYGGESAMWAEIVSAETIDSRTWPFTAAIAERLWSPREVRDVKDMYRRLDVVSTKLEYLGLTHNKNYEVMLKRLTNGADIPALKTFVDAVEPMKELSRRKQGITYYTRTPLTMVVDAARPDSKVAREFSWMVDDFVQNPNKELANKIKSQYKIWIANHAKLKETMKVAPAIREIEPVSENLAKLSATGVKLVDYIMLKSSNKLTAKSKMTFDEHDKREDEMRFMVKPKGNVEIVMLINATKKLLANTID